MALRLFLQRRGAKACSRSSHWLARRASVVARTARREPLNGAPGAVLPSVKNGSAAEEQRSRRRHAKSWGKLCASELRLRRDL